MRRYVGMGVPGRRAGLCVLVMFAVCSGRAGAEVPLTVELDRRPHSIQSLRPPRSGQPFGWIRLKPAGWFTRSVWVQVPAAQWTQVTEVLDAVRAPGTMLQGKVDLANYTQAGWDPGNAARGRRIGPPSGAVRFFLGAQNTLETMHFGIAGVEGSVAAVHLEARESGPLLSQIRFSAEALRPGSSEFFLANTFEYPRVARLVLVAVDGDRVRAVFSDPLRELESGRRTTIEILNIPVSGLRYIGAGDLARSDFRAALQDQLVNSPSDSRELFFPGALAFAHYRTGEPATADRNWETTFTFETREVSPSPRSRAALLASFARPARPAFRGVDCVESLTYPGNLYPGDFSSN